MTPPHEGQPVERRGPDPSIARLVVVAVHGRGASAENILRLVDEMDLDGVACLAPQAAESTWYPKSFLAPFHENEPWLTSGLTAIDGVVTSLEREGVTADRVALLGFSQGACLTLEYAARHPRRYYAIVGFSGGLIGPPGTPRTYAGAFGGTPVFLGCSDVDAHIPLERVHESAAVFRAMGAQVDERIYPGMGHLVSPEEIEAVRTLLRTQSARRR